MNTRQFFSMMAMCVAFMASAQDATNNRTPEQFQQELKQFGEETRAMMMQENNTTANNQIVNLFEGDSLAQLNEVQGKLLDSVITLVVENDSVVFIPQELNQMMGDTAKVSYISYPDWSVAYFKKKSKKDYYLYVPTYAETPQGIICSEIFIEFEKDNSINCFVETILPIDNEMEMNMMYIASSLQGEFLRSKAYKERDIRAHKLGINQSYFKNERKAQLGYYERYKGPNIYKSQESGLNAHETNKMSRIRRNRIHGLDTKWY